MNDLYALTVELDTLAQCYLRRSRLNSQQARTGFHPDNDYLIAQAARFDEAAWQVKLAIQAAKDHASGLLAEVNA